jgi:hypothetical protein
VQDVGQDITNTYPMGFLLVGLAVLFLRLEDPNAWLLALTFAGFIAIPGTASSYAGLNPSLRSFALAYRALFGNMVTPLFYFFFAVFPTRSPLDRHLPWLKWIAIVVASYFPLMDLLGRPPSGPHILVLSFFYGLLALGIVSLIWNAFSAPSPEARRKIRVIVLGTLLGVVRATLVLGATDFLGFKVPLLLDVAIVVLLWLFPLSLPAGATGLYHPAVAAQCRRDIGFCSFFCPLSRTPHRSRLTRRYCLGDGLWITLALDRNGGA